MASYVGAITEYNPYVQQIPTEAYTKVGMFKEQQYEAGLAKIQDTVDKIAGLDVANEGGRQYLRNRVDELTSSLNKYSYVDFSNPNNVSQLVSLAKPLYQDENIVNDVINTSVFRKWSKDAADAYKNGKMELGQYMRETTDANVWLNSQVAGAQYTGRSTPNTATKKDLVDRIIKAKKDGLEKNEYVYDKSYSMDTPYYVKSTNKYYSEADFNNFIANNLMSTRDREMLMNDHWYENMGKSTEQLQAEDIALYQSKIDANNIQIEYLKSFGDPSNGNNIWVGDKKTEYQQKIKDLENYNKTLKDGKIAYLRELNPLDPNTRDVYHRDLAESRFISSLDILRDEVRKEEYQKNEQWFLEKAAELDLAKEAARNAAKVAKATKPGSITEIEDEVAVFTPVDPSAPKTEVSLNVIRTGYQRKNEEIVASMNGLIGKLQANGIDVNQYIAGWDQVQVGTKAGASMSIPRFKDNASKEKFYNMVAGLNYAYTMEAADGNLDNKDFRKFVEGIAGYNDNDPNSKFTYNDKLIGDALNSMKGTSALLPKLEGLFADKGVVRSLAQIDSALKDKKDMANAYREALLKSNALTGTEMAALGRLTDDQILSNSYFFDLDQERRRYGAQGYKPLYSYKQEQDGTYGIYQSVYEDLNNDILLGSHDRDLIDDRIQQYSNKGNRLIVQNRLAGGFKSPDDAASAFRNEGQLNLASGISNESMKKAEEFVKRTYSYVQENLNSTVVNLKNDKDAYAAVQDGLTLFLNRARLQATPQDISIEGGTIDPKTLSGIGKVEVLGASVNNTEDIFNPNPVYEVQFTATMPSGDKEVTRTFNGTVSLKSFLATNPNYRTSDYAKYFAPALYSEKDAYARIHAAVNPLEGSEASYANRGDILPVYERIRNDNSRGFAQDTTTDVAWETLPIEKDGKQTMVSYQVVSLGQNTILGNIKNKDGNQYAPGAFYVKLKIPTTTGTPKTIFLKRPNGDSFSFNSASYAHYTVRDLIFNNPELKFDELDPKTGQANFFTTDPTTIRGIFNSQLAYNGFSKLETIKMKDALGKEIVKQQAKELQFGTR